MSYLREYEQYESQRLEIVAEANSQLASKESFEKYRKTPEEKKALAEAKALFKASTANKQ